ncbi:hypothetical protein B6V72_17960 [Thioclava sp. F34-6]|nr:hypothetical protein B6V72_17960 [Thioclava sp. F34-6]
MKRLADEIAQGPLEMPDPARRWTIPVAFEGDDCPQLRDVARATGQSEAATIRENCANDLRVLTIGFALGQPYIGLLVRGGPPWERLHFNQYDAFAESCQLVLVDPRDVSRRCPVAISLSRGSA